MFRSGTERRACVALALRRNLASAYRTAASTTLLAMLSLAFALCAAAAQESDGNGFAAKTAARRSEVEQAIERLRAVDAEQAEKFSAELQGIGRARDERLKRRSSEFEIHAVEVSRGAPPPSGLIQGKDRFTARYAEVHLTYAKRPVLLILKTGEPMYWKVTAEDGVRLAAVLLLGDASQNVLGLGDDVWVVPPTDDSNRNWKFDAKGNSLGLHMEFGRDVSTVFATGEYDGQPIVVGPESPDWIAQYSISALDELLDRVTSVEQALNSKKHAKRLENLRFFAMFYQEFGESSERYITHDRHTTSVPAEFTVAGPIEETLRPRRHGLSCLVRDDKEGLEFAIGEHGDLVVIGASPDPKDQAKVPADGALLGSQRFERMVLDAKRRRLVLTVRDGRDKPLAAYDLATNVWSVLQPKFGSLSSFTYVKTLDQMFAIPPSADPRHNPEEAAQPRDKILKLDADGKLIETINTSRPMDLGDSDLGSTQILYVDDLLVVLGRPSRRPEIGGAGRMYVVDPATGLVLHEGPQKLWSREPLPESTPIELPPAPPPIVDRRGNVTVGGILSGFAMLEAEAESLRSAGESDAAAALEGQIAALRDELTGKSAGEPSHAPELHLVGSHEASTMNVHVTAKTHPIVLVMCAYNQTLWKLKVDPGVTLKRIIVGGYHRQELEGAPPGVQTDMYSYDDRKPPSFNTYSREDDSHAGAEKAIHELTGMQIDTMQGKYQHGGVPVFVGPESPAWRMERVARRLSRLVAPHVARRQAAALKRLESIEFEAVYRFGGERRIPGRGDENLLGKFTIRGPLEESLEPIPGRGGEAFRDPADGALYLPRGYEFAKRLRDGTVVEIPFDPRLPSLSHPSAAVFDTKRRRLLISSHGGGGFVYAYDAPAKQWSVLRSRGLSTPAIAYSKETDLLYVLNTGASVISTYTPDGACIGVAELSGKVSSGRHDFGSSIQLRAVGPLVAIITNGSTASDGLRRKLPRIFVVDPKTGEFLYAGVLRPQSTPRKLSNDELESLWIGLLDASDADVDGAVANLSAAGDASVAFLAARVGQTAPPDLGDAGKLIEELGTDKFEARNAAFRRLAELGPAAAPHLKAAADHESAEVRLRVEQLLESIASDEPATKELRREFRAVKALAQIGTPDAIDVVNRLLRRGPDDPLARHAGKALDRFQSGEEEISPSNEKQDGKPDAAVRARML